VEKGKTVLSTSYKTNNLQVAGGYFVRKKIFGKISVSLFYPVNFFKEKGLLDSQKI